MEIQQSVKMSSVFLIKLCGLCLFMEPLISVIDSCDRRHLQKKVRKLANRIRILFADQFVVIYLARQSIQR